MFVCPLTTVAGVCVHACILYMCVWCVYLCRGERGGGQEFCFPQCSVPEACRLQLAVVTTSKLCRKIATVSGKPHFSGHHNYR